MFFYDILANNLVSEPLYFYFVFFLLMPRKLLDLSDNNRKQSQINTVSCTTERNGAGGEVEPDDLSFTISKRQTQWRGKELLNPIRSTLKCSGGDVFRGQQINQLFQLSQISLTVHFSLSSSLQAQP